MLTELFAYDPSAVDPAIREQMAGILKARGEILRASAEVSDLRARSWAGEAGIGDLAELKGADLAKLREDYMNQLRPLVMSAVDVEGLVEMLPMFALALLGKFKVPPMLLLEALGLDIDNIKKLAEGLKELIDENR